MFPFSPSPCCHLIAAEKSPRGLGNLLGGFFPTEGHRGGCQGPPGCPKPKAEDVLGKPSPGRGRSLQFPCSGIPWDHTLLLFQQCQTLLGSTWPLPRFRASLATNPFSHIHNCSLCWRKSEQILCNALTFVLIVGISWAVPDSWKTALVHYKINSASSVFIIECLFLVFCSACFL